MTELGGIFTQLAQMVSEQGEQIQRIDADTDAVVEVSLHSYTSCIIPGADWGMVEQCD